MITRWKAARKVECGKATNTVNDLTPQRNHELIEAQARLLDVIRDELGDYLYARVQVSNS